MISLGIRYDLRNPAFAGTSVADRYAAALDQVEWADGLGFDSVTLSEHHGVDDGYLPSIFAFAAAIAARTQRIKINLAAVIAPLHDPLRLAEDAAVVDNLSRGRLSIVLANGYVPFEFAMFGRELRDRPKLVTEAVHTLRTAWSGEPFEFRGRTARVTPRPFQPNGPPILLGGGAEPAARRAARIADGFVPSTPDLWVHYRDELAKLGKPDCGDPVAGSGMYLHVANDPEATWAEVGPYALYEMNAYGQWAAESGASTGYQPMADAAALRMWGLHNVMTPEQVVDACRSGRFGALGFHPMMGGVPPELSWSNLRLFESAVLPALREGA